MNRRDLIKLLGLATTLPSVAAARPFISGQYSFSAEPDEENQQEAFIKDLLHKTRNPDEHHPGDIIATPEKILLLKSAYQRLTNLQRTVGYGNFGILAFDDGLKVAGRYSQVGKFPKAELEELEAVFYTNAQQYGFLGDKPVDNLTSSIKRRDTIKIPYSGHFLYRGQPQQMFEEVRKLVGPSLILTSGIRSVTKQMHLFLGKASRHDWNLSLASRSLAPPGYSFHGIGDFDVGKKGLAAKNFTEAFAETDEYKRLVDLGFVAIRYPVDNQLGVRYEPWHIKVA